jgi:GxxExxY protein
VCGRAKGPVDQFARFDIAPWFAGIAQFVLVKITIYNSKYLSYYIRKMDSQTYQIIGAALEVHNELGCGFLEPVYQEALELEFGYRCIPFRPQVETPVFYKGRKLKAPYRADFVCYDAIIVELKALAKLGEIEWAQVLNYLKASTHERGLLINFGARSLEHRRFVWSHEGPKGQKIE